MKLILLLISFSLLAAKTLAQFSDLEKEFMNFENNYKDSLTQSMYFDSTFCSTYHLKNITKQFTRMNVWQNNIADTEDFIRVCDIRWRFKNHSEALTFHKKYISVNSEGGEEIKKANISIDKITELRVFRESAEMRKMNEALGGTMYFYYYLFVVDNVMAKVFVSSKKNITTERAAIFAKEAARRLNESLKGD